MNPKRSILPLRRSHFSDRRCGVLLLLAIVIGCIGPWAPGAGADPSLRTIPPAVQQQIDAWPLAGAYRLDDLVRYDARHGRLIVDFTLPASLQKQLADEAEHAGGVRLAIQDSPCLWTLQRTEAGVGRMARLRPGKGPFNELTCYDTRGSAPFLCVKLMASPTAVAIVGQEMSPVAGHGRDQFVLALQPDLIELTLRISPAAPVRHALASLDYFEKGDADVYRSYFTPVARRLGLGHLLHRRPAADVYRVFDHIQPDAESAQQVGRLMDLSNSADFNQRQRAGDDLRRLGRPAVLAVLRLPRETLWPEQQRCIDSLLRDDDWRSLPNLAMAKRDLPFLLDCLDDEDAAVRKAAKAAASDLLQAQLQFDVDRAPEARLAAVDDLVDQAQKSERLSTQVNGK